MKLFSSMVRFIAGEDIFISYSRADAVTYAQSLANELSKLDFLCYLDQWGSQPGAELPASLKLTVWRSTVLVLVGSEGASNSTAVRDEVEIFLKTKRTLIPISIDGALEQAKWFQSIEGLALSKESKAALLSGEPTPSLVNRIDKSFQFSRRREKTRRAIYGTLVLIAVLLSVTGGAVILGNMRIAEARRQQLIAEGAKDKAQADKAQVEISLNQSKEELRGTLDNLSNTRTELTKTNTELSQQRIIAAGAKADAQRALDLKARAEASAEQAVRETQRRIWQEQASVASIDRRFDLAELALARASEADPRGSGELLPLYREARQRRLLTPFVSLALPSAQRLALLGSWESEPFVVIQDHNTNALHLNFRNAATTIQDTCDSQPFITSKGPFLVWTCGKRINSIRVSAPRELKTRLLDRVPEDLAVIGSELRLIERQSEGVLIRTLNPETLGEVTMRQLGSPPEAGLIKLCPESQHLAYSINISGTSFNVKRWAASAETPQSGEFSIPDTQGVSPPIGGSVQEAWSAPDCGRFIVSYSSGFSVLGPASGDGWAQIDLNSPRPTRALDADIKSAIAVDSASGVEAEYLMRAGDLRQLLAVSPILNESPVRTVARQVRAFAEWKPPGGVPSELITIIADDKYLTVFSGASVSGRYPLEVSNVLKLAVSDDGSLIAVEGQDKVVFWLRAPTNQAQEIPTFKRLSQELGIVWTKGEEPKYFFRQL